MGILRGLWAPFRGAAFVARHGLWLYVLAPVLVNLVIVAGTTLFGVHLVRQRLGTSVLGSSPLAAIGLWVVGGVLGLVFFVILQPLFGAPFIDALTEKAERIVRGDHPRVPLLVAAWRSLWHGGLKLLCYAAALLLVVVLSALTGIGGGIMAVLSAVLLAFDGFDYPLARRGAGFGGKWEYLLVHPGQTLGYCVGATLLYLVPLAIVVAPAFAAVGATLAFLDTDTGGGSRTGATPASNGGARPQ
jgi:CysZ protein